MLGVQIVEGACSREKYIEVRPFEHSWKAALLALASVVPQLRFGQVVSVECANFSKEFRSLAVLTLQDFPEHSLVTSTGAADYHCGDEI